MITIPLPNHVVLDPHTLARSVEHELQRTLIPQPVPITQGKGIKWDKLRKLKHESAMDSNRKDSELGCHRDVVDLHALQRVDDTPDGGTDQFLEVSIHQRSDGAQIT